MTNYSPSLFSHPKTGIYDIYGWLCMIFMDIYDIYGWFMIFMDIYIYMDDYDYIVVTIGDLSIRSGLWSSHLGRAGAAALCRLLGIVQRASAMGLWSAHRSRRAIFLWEKLQKMTQHHWFAIDKYTVIIYIYIYIYMNKYIITHPYIIIIPLQKRGFSLAEVWRVAFRQVVRIGESAKVGLEMPWKCHGHAIGKTKGVQPFSIFWKVEPFSGDFLEKDQNLESSTIFWRFWLEADWKQSDWWLIFHRQGNPLWVPVGSDDFLESHFLHKRQWRLWRHGVTCLERLGTVSMLVPCCLRVRFFVDLFKDAASAPPDRGERKVLPWPRRCDMNWYV